VGLELLIVERDIFSRPRRVSAGFRVSLQIRPASILQTRPTMIASTPYALAENTRVGVSAAPPV